MIAAGQNDAAPRGRFITFEGGEGAGKSTQMKRLAASLAERGIAVVETREPGGTPDAEAIRSFILSGRARPLAPRPRPDASPEGPLRARRLRPR